MLSPRRNTPSAGSSRRLNQRTCDGHSPPSPRVMLLSRLNTAISPGCWWQKIFAFDSTYSSMSRWTSRWFGARFVMTAMCGLTSIVMSWKLDSSSTAQSVCAISPASHSSGWPMLPPTWTVFPAARSSSITPAGVHGRYRACPCTRRPTFSGWNASTSFSGAMASSTRRSRIPSGSGSCTRMPSTSARPFSSAISVSSSLSVVCAGRRKSMQRMPHSSQSRALPRT